MRENWPKRMSKSLYLQIEPHPHTVDVDEIGNLGGRELLLTLGARFALRTVPHRLDAAHRWGKCARSTTSRDKRGGQMPQRVHGRIMSWSEGWGTSHIGRKRARCGMTWHLERRRVGTVRRRRMLREKPRKKKREKKRERGQERVIEGAG